MSKNSKTMLSLTALLGEAVAWEEYNRKRLKTKRTGVTTSPKEKRVKKRRAANKRARAARKKNRRS